MFAFINNFQVFEGLCCSRHSPNKCMKHALKQDSPNECDFTFLPTSKCLGIANILPKNIILSRSQVSNVFVLNDITHKHTLCVVASSCVFGLLRRFSVGLHNNLMVVRTWGSFGAVAADNTNFAPSKWVHSSFSSSNLSGKCFRLGLISRKLAPLDSFRKRSTTITDKKLANSGHCLQWVFWIFSNRLFVCLFIKFSVTPKRGDNCVISARREKNVESYHVSGCQSRFVCVVVGS